jgi:hypothetical protein
MKQVRLAAFLSSIFSLFALSSVAQTSQPPKAEPTQRPAQATSQNAPPQITTPDKGQKVADPSGTEGGRIKVKIVPRRDKKNIPWQLPDAPLALGALSQGAQDRILNAMPLQSPGGFDRGIYVQRMAGTGTVCGSIVSYNFSPGENPILESVTKCTPTDGTAVHRTDGQDEKPAVPQFREIKDTPPKP